MRQLINSRLVEVRIGYLLPFFLALALWSNFQIAQASPLQLREFAPVVIRASRQADYSADPVDLVFAPVEASILEDIRNDAQGEPGSGDEADAAVAPAPTSGAAPGEQSTPTGTQPAIGGTATPSTVSPAPNQQTPTSQASASSGGSPTALPIIQTVAPIIPTVVPILPTVAPIIPTALPVVPTLVPVIPTVIAPIATLVPIPVPTICVPLPPLNNCS
jgi:hypothetical protein